MRTTIRAVCSQKDDSCLSNWNLTTLQLLLSILVAFTPMCLYRQVASSNLVVEETSVHTRLTRKVAQDIGFRVLDEGIFRMIMLLPII